MFHASRLSRVLSLTAFAMLLAGLTASHALTPAGAKRPTTVPAEYVITPFGYFHPSCVKQLAEGDEVRQDQKAIKHADGSYEDMHTCAYSHFDPRGASSVPDAPSPKEPTISHAWVEYSGVTTSSSSYALLTANWTVPPAPSKNDGQTVFLFPGLEDYKDVVTIIQPVLGWNSDYAAAWGIASWNCCTTGTVYESTPVKVNSGDSIQGYMFDTCASGTVSCATWDIVTADLTTGKSTQLLNTSAQGQTFNWAFAGALEVYNIVQCGDYPSNSATTFYNLGLYDPGFSQVVNPAWSVTNQSSKLTPQCAYGGNLKNQITLDY